MNPQYLVHLGRQPAISLAEIESVYGARIILEVHENFALLGKEINISRLGGSQKLTKVVAESDAHEWPTLAKATKQYVQELSKELEDGKLTLGLSLHGIQANRRSISACLMDIKSSLKAQGRSMRAVEGKGIALSGAQVLHNKLFKPKKIELSLVRFGGRTLLTRTLAVQDIEAYSRRDQGRPARDARVGMLPPKLAQILINLSVGTYSPTTAHPKPTVLDPFCGTGVLLQEGLLLDYNVYGTDLEPRMVEYSQKNINWLWDTHKLKDVDWHVEVGDATSHHWGETFTHIAAETYLGQPLSTLASPDDLRRIVPSVDKLHRDFLINMAGYLDSSQTLALGVPAWAKKDGSFTHLPLLDSIGELGYNFVDFEHASRKELIYHRPGQAVAREILVLKKM